MVLLASALARTHSWPIPLLLPTLLSPLPMAGIDPGVKINWDFFPFMSFVKDVAGGVFAFVIVALLVIGLVGCLVWLGGKVTGKTGVQQTAGSFIGWVFLGALIAANLGSGIEWITSFELFN